MWIYISKFFYISILYAENIICKKFSSEEIRLTNPLQRPQSRVKKLYSQKIFENQRMTMGSLVHLTSASSACERGQRLTKKYLIVRIFFGSGVNETIFVEIFQNVKLT